MAGISTKPILGGLYPRMVPVITRLLLTAGAAVDAASDNGKAGAWAKDATGLYTFTLSSDKKVNGGGFTGAGMAVATMRAAAATTVGVEIVSEDYSGGTIQIRTFTKSTGAAVDVGAVHAVNLSIWLIDSSVT